VVAKFYRPERWSDAQILEEHAFAAELMAVRGTRRRTAGARSGQTLHHFGGFAFSRQPAPRRPPAELDDGEVLEWIGRFLARIHTVGARQPFCTPPRPWTCETLRRRAHAVAAGEHEMVPLDVQSAWTRAV